MVTFILDSAGKPAFHSEAGIFMSVAHYIQYMGGFASHVGTLMRPLPSLVKVNGSGEITLFLLLPDTFNQQKLRLWTKDTT